jgi:hypothetical protein
MCVQGGVSGMCVSSCTGSGKSYCAFPDPTDCAASGLKWGILAGEGLAGSCTTTCSAVDAGRIDAAVHDSGPTDAALSDAGYGPPVNNNQTADLVLGQPDFVSMLGNNGGESSMSLASPLDVWSNGASLWTSEFVNKRVLQWNSLPIANDAPASMVVGQGDFMTTANVGPDQLHFGHMDVTTSLPHHVYVASDGTHIFASDSDDNRILIWNTLPTVFDTQADIVLGQTGFTTRIAGAGATQLSSPTYLWTDGVRLIVADSGNSRVLIWTLPITTNAQAAQIVLGQPDFGFGAPPSTTSASTMEPSGVWSDGVRLFVADTGANRVLIWNSIPASNDQPADVVVGQGSSSASSANAGMAGVNGAGFDHPLPIAVGFDSLFVGDTLNHRVLVFNPIPSTNGSTAARVLGQDALDAAASPAVGPSGISTPVGLAMAGKKLFVADETWARVLRFTLRP